MISILFLYLTKLIIDPQGGSIYKHITKSFLSLALFVAYFICIHGKNKTGGFITIMIFVLEWKITVNVVFLYFVVINHIIPYQ